MRLALILALVAGCGLYPDKDDAGTDADASDDGLECSATVTVPGAFGETTEDAADPHEEAFGGSPEPFGVHIGWPSVDPSTSIAFLWRSDLDTKATVVEYGVGSFDNRVEGASFVFGGTGSGDGYRMHEVKLCSGLEPGTTYQYRVGGEGHWSPTYSFTTPGAPGSFDTFRLAIVGDSRGAYATWGEVLAAMATHDPDAILFTGDMVEFGTLQGEWDAWFEASGDILARIPLVPTHGNHEFLAASYFAHFSAPNNEQWFHHLLGDAVIVSLNDTVADDEHLESVEPDYLDAVLETYDDRTKIVMHHQSIYAACSRHGSDTQAREFWEPVIDRHQVELVVAGHNHVYERSVPIRASGEVGLDEGTTYLVAGGAGAPLYDEFDDTWFNAVANPIEHYVIADFTPGAIDIVARDLAGNVIDQITLPR